MDKELQLCCSKQDLKFFKDLNERDPTQEVMTYELMKMVNIIFALIDSKIITKIREENEEFYGE